MIIVFTIGGLAVGASFGWIACEISHIHDGLARMMYGTGPDGKPLPRNPEHFGGAK